MKAESVFNLDEVEMLEWENRKPRKVIVPKTIAGETVHHCVLRGVKYISIIACITAAGESLMPDIVTSQDFESLRKRLMHQGVRIGVDLTLKQQSKPYLGANVFLEYMNIIFVPCLTELRGTKEFETRRVVLFMNNCSSHTSDDIITIVTRKRVKMFTFAPHTTHIFQMLDVVLFWALKKYATGRTMLDEEQMTVAFIIKVYHDFKQMMIEVNI
jgi:hypothetical protein